MDGALWLLLLLWLLFFGRLLVHYLRPHHFLTCLLHLLPRFLYPLLARDHLAIFRLSLLLNITTRLLLHL